VTELAIATHQLRKVYRSGFLRRPFVGLDGLDLEVRRGEVFGYVGHNGSGKTTTLKILMGLNKATSGSGEILGQPIGDLRTRARIGFLPERPYFYDYLTAEEFLHFYGQLHGMPTALRRERIDALIPLVHMERARKVQLRKFSKGMLQRVGVAQALINDPDLVIMDEPSSGLDPMGRMLIRDIILGLKKRGKTVLFSSHVLSDVEEVCDRVAIISGGKLQEVAQVHELTERGASRVEVTIRGLDDDAIGVVHDSPPILRQGGDVTWSVEDSERADALVRAGHREGGSVVALRPRRETLEQLFLKDAASITAVTP
jgi:ABC-2 type transport system ATP-binding protein